ncbi:unnamed protein product [Lepidochelys kempii]
MQLVAGFHGLKSFETMAYLGFCYPCCLIISGCVGFTQDLVSLSRAKWKPASLHNPAENSIQQVGLSQISIVYLQAAGTKDQRSTRNLQLRLSKEQAVRVGSWRETCLLSSVTGIGGSTGHWQGSAPSRRAATLGPTSGDGLQNDSGQRRSPHQGHW